MRASIFSCDLHVLIQKQLFRFLKGVQLDCGINLIVFHLNPTCSIPSNWYEDDLLTFAFGPPNSNGFRWFDDLLPLPSEGRHSGSQAPTSELHYTKSFKNLILVGEDRRTSSIKYSSSSTTLHPQHISSLEGRKLQTFDDSQLKNLYPRWRRKRSILGRRIKVSCAHLRRSHAKTSGVCRMKSSFGSTPHRRAHRDQHYPQRDVVDQEFVVVYILNIRSNYNGRKTTAFEAAPS